MSIERIIEREFAKIKHIGQFTMNLSTGELRALLQEAVEGAMGKVGCPSCGDSCEHEWVLISPENLRFTGKSAFEVVRKEMNSRIPPAKQLENIIKANEAAEFDYQADVAMAVAKAVEAERKDAERYRFVRAEHDRIDPICRVSWKMFGQRNSTNWGNVIDGEHLDELVAAAIAAEGK